MKNDFLDKEPSADPTARPAEPIAHWLYGGFAFALALFLLISLPYQTTHFEKVVWSKQPSTWPSIAIIGMLLAGIGQFLVMLRAERSENPLPFKEDLLILLRALELSFWFIIYIYAVGYFGFLPSNIIFTIFLCMRLGIRTPMHVSLLTLTSVVIVILFKAMLQVKIPGGHLYNYLPETLSVFFNTYL